MAEYAKDYDAIRATGADVAALSVDSPARSAALQAQLDLPYPLLCDPSRSVVREWDLYNAHEMGGIAIPSVFVIGTNRRVRYRSVDTTTRRVSTEGVLRFLRDETGPESIQRENVRARVGDFVRAFGNAIRRGLRTPEE